LGVGITHSSWPPLQVPMERYLPSPSAERRSGEHWRARLGLTAAALLLLSAASAAVRIVRLG
jgi:hypothetical protein